MAERHVTKLRQNSHRSHEERAAAVQVALNHELLLRVQRVVRRRRVGQTKIVHAIINRVVRQPPHHDRIRLEVSELRTAARVHFPKRVADTGGVQDVRVRAVGNRDGRVCVFGGGVVGVHQQNGRCRNANESEIRPTVVVRRAVARRVRRTHGIKIRLAGNQPRELHDVRSDKCVVRDGEI